MAQPYSATSATHKRTYDDIGPEDAGPSGSLTNPVGSSSSPSGSRERNKRARNDADSAYTSEVDDIILSSNTSVSSSSSGSSLSSYHSARSTLTATSPSLLPVGEDADNEPSSLDVRSPSMNVSDIIADTLPFIPGPNPMPAPSTAAQTEPIDSADRFRRTLERVDAFDREMAALRQSPTQLTQQEFQPPLWQSWSTLLPPSLHESSFPYGSAFALPPRLPETHPTRSSVMRNHPTTAPILEVPIPDLLHSISNSVPADEDDILSFSPLRDNAPRAQAYLEPQLPSSGSYEDRRRRLLAYERDVARHGDSLVRHRPREELHDRFLRDRPETFRSTPVTSYTTSLDSPRSLERRRSHPSIASTPANRQSSSSTRTTPLFPDLHSLVDDHMRREHDREIRNLDHTIREAEAHRQRIVDFLAETDSTSRPSAGRATRDRPSPVSYTSSSYSTLRGALDDTAVRHRDSIPPRRTAGSSTRPHGFVLDNSSDRLQSSGTSLSDDLLERGYQDIESLSFSRDPGLSAYRSLPPRRTQLEDILDLSPPPRELSFTDRSLYASATSLPQGSYLEANSRARSFGISGLRHRARLRSPSPPSPGFSLATWYSSEPFGPDNSRYTSRAASVPSRPFEDRTSQRAPSTFTDGAMHRLFPDLVQPPAYPERPPVPPPPPPTRSRRYGHIDLSAYHDGPFRASLARSMTLQMQNTRDHQVSERSMAPETRRQDVPIEESSSEEDESFSQHSQHIAALRNEGRRLIERSSQPRSSGPGNMPTFTEGSSRLVSGPMSRRVLPDRRPPVDHGISPMDIPGDLPRSNQEPETHIPTELNPPSAPTASARHRTLLNRERSFVSLADFFDGELSARTARLERWDQRRDLLRRTHRAREHGEPRPYPLTPSGTTGVPSSQPSRHDDAPAPPHVHQPTHSSAPGRYRPLLSTFTSRVHPTDTRTEERATPLNGRFARTRGLASHMRPDMVLVDLPTSRAAHYRRRYLGDYMRDDEFDMSYEGLLSLTTLLGDVKPRGTPMDVISSLPKGKYSEWAHPGETEERCPICLDDYQATDACLRIPGCSHWFHEGCLQQWLKSARTCPVCRGRVNKPRTSEASAPVVGPSRPNRNNNRDDDDDDEDDDDSDRDGERTPRLWSPYRPPWRND